MQGLFASHEKNNTGNIRHQILTASNCFPVTSGHHMDFEANKVSPFCNCMDNYMDMYDSLKGSSTVNPFKKWNTTEQQDWNKMVRDTCGSSMIRATQSETEYESGFMETNIVLGILGWCTLSLVISAMNAIDYNVGWIKESGKWVKYVLCVLVMAAAIAYVVSANVIYSTPNNLVLSISIAVVGILGASAMALNWSTLLQEKDAEKWMYVVYIRQWYTYFLILAIMFPVMRCVQQNRDGIDNLICVMLSFVIAAACCTIGIFYPGKGDGGAAGTEKGGGGAAVVGIDTEKKSGGVANTNEQKIFESIMPIYMGILSFLTFMCLYYNIQSHAVLSQPFSNVNIVIPIVLPMLMIPMVVQACNLSSGAIYCYIFDIFEFTSRTIVALAIVSDVMNTNIQDI